MNLVKWVLIVGVGLGSTACAGKAPVPDLPGGTEPHDPVYIESTQILQLESFPVQVMLEVVGQLPDVCHKAAWVVSDPELRGPDRCRTALGGPAWPGLHSSPAADDTAYPYRKFQGRQLCCLAEWREGRGFLVPGLTRRKASPRHLWNRGKKTSQRRPGSHVRATIGWRLAPWSESWAQIAR